jgi:hypothetical protein
MNAPNRQADVARIFNELGLEHHAKTATDEKRRENLFTIIRELNKLDNGQWGVLVKTDQANKIPGDIAVWKPTLEHFDVITGAGGPFWEAKGLVPSSRWHWQAVPGSQPQPEPQPTPIPTPTPSPTPTPENIMGLLASILAELKAIRTELAEPLSYHITPTKTPQ